MDELHVRPEQPRLLERHDRAGAGRMHGDRQAERAGAIPVALDVLDRQDSARCRRRAAADGHGAEIARTDAHGQQIVLVGHPVALDPSQPCQVHRRIVGKADRRAVGEASADAHVAHRGELGVGVLGAARIVRPVVNRGDAGGDRVDGRETGRAIVILRLHQRTETRRHREVTKRGNIGPNEQAERRGPHVHMRIDESRDADHPGAVDHLSRRRLDPLGDGDDGAVADMHVAAG